MLHLNDLHQTLANFLISSFMIGNSCSRFVTFFWPLLSSHIVFLLSKCKHIQVKNYRFLSHLAKKSLAGNFFFLVQCDKKLLNFWLFLNQQNNKFHSKILTPWKHFLIRDYSLIFEKISQVWQNIIFFTLILLLSLSHSFLWKSVLLVKAIIRNKTWHILK